MVTFAQMTDEVSRRLAGFTLRQDRQTYLTAAVTTTALEVYVNSTNNISYGIIQIDDELMYVDSFDRSNNRLIIAPYGRGYNGTTVAAHAINSKVTIAPTFPNVDIKNAINETIHATFPSLYIVDSVEFPFQPARTTYALPDDARRVLSVAYESVGPSKEWIPIRSYRVDNMANVSQFNSRNTVSLYSMIVPGRTVQVYYTSPANTFANNSDDFEATTGLPASARDVIILGAQYRLVSSIDPGRLTFGSAEADQQSQIAGRAYNAGSSSSKYLYALYQQRLDEEGRKLDENNPIRIHYSK
jgi:hypothetical protein